MRYLTTVLALCAMALPVTSRHACAADQTASPPYPPSPVIAGVTFDQSTWIKAAPGSDQFGTTWAADDNLYLAWGDGGGFGGTNSLGRASLGVGRLEGLPPQWQGVNVWGGVNPLSRQPPIPGKTSSGVVCVAGALYLYVSEQGVWTNNRLWKSTDLGRMWTELGPVFREPGKAFADPGIIQFGRDYQGARDNYVYGYSEEPWPTALGLFRVPQDRLADRSAYEFFAGFDDDKPLWTPDITQQKPVFTDPNGTEWGVTCVHHPVLKRYLLAVRHAGDSGEWGLFDAPEPWGPWTTVAYGKDFPEWTCTPDPKGASKGRPAWLHTFPAKWISEDGKTLWHLSDRGDQLNLMRVTLQFR
ncbi:MAG: hypothetical protein COZ06_23255 [Armatimonadetes bacterium CG_4_10_14_3_um_filter_66_18]|nr:DUF4185 domain-containing protein [Armatimonadota bacterium]OIO99440.1 MAG: hypothetical protein AUJ96_19545 [Armatimonadetes bacterium CG2_30_66_41]PIU87938.1 MAG: hypothetical protein COS65_32190 [Armatimonadetes bacterium CG06_land_8_20_14_3_00_66_21]PIX47536.1 MAG: hypothetical protein COZ57_08245 [Armatimonadetes bacterium CG_4_8_14_3_um_filter_66_20]PIY43256.1 MAG: hypothetical protein COZ06_23255 [Armatimonadetes bacterium CG_4_10_14_3_um_filter_66_18]PIZ40527.1 MAG: hypothetical pro